MSIFEKWDLESNILDAIKSRGWVEPTEIQLDSIPLARKGRDNVGQAKTGSGKTAAFGIPIIERCQNKGFPQSSTSFATAFDDYYYTFRNNLGCEINTIKNNNQINSIFAYNSYKRIKNTFLKDLTNLTQIILNDPAAQDTSCFNMIMWKTSVTNKNKKKIR